MAIPIWGTTTSVFAHKKITRTKVRAQECEARKRQWPKAKQYAARLLCVCSMLKHSETMVGWEPDVATCKSMRTNGAALDKAVAPSTGAQSLPRALTDHSTQLPPPRALLAPNISTAARTNTRHLVSTTCAASSQH